MVALRLHMSSVVRIRVKVRVRVRVRVRAPYELCRTGVEGVQLVMDGVIVHFCPLCIAQP